MRYSGFTYGLFFLLCAEIVLIGCDGNTSEQKQSAAIQVTDFRGRKLALNKPAEQVVCLIESALSGIYMLGKQDNVIGIPGDVYIGETWQRYSELDIRIREKSLPTPGNWDFVSLEQVVSLEPDLVIIWSSQTQAIENIERFNIPVYAVMMHSLEDVFKEVEDLGKLLDAENRAGEILGFTKDQLKTIAHDQTAESFKTAYFMWAQGINETSGQHSTVQGLFRYAGVKNVCDLHDEHATINIEKLHDWDPDMIVMWYNEKLDPVDVIENPLLQGLKAVREKQVYELPSAFDCDFWTLKFLYPVQLIHFWAYANQDTTAKPDPENLLRVLYNQSLSDE